MVTILLALPSCRSLDTVTTDALLFSSHGYLRESSDSLVTRDSIYTRDSIFESERQRADTVYRERIVYRDRVTYRDRWRERIVHDTIVHTDSIVEVIEHPPRAYPPKFYKWSTAVFWLLILAYIAYLILRSKIPHL